LEEENKNLRRRINLLEEMFSNLVDQLQHCKSVVQELSTSLKETNREVFRLRKLRTDRNQEIVDLKCKLERLEEENHTCQKLLRACKGWLEREDDTPRSNRGGTRTVGRRSWRYGANKLHVGGERSKFRKWSQNSPGRVKGNKGKQSFLVCHCIQRSLFVRDSSSKFRNQIPNAWSSISRNLSERGWPTFQCAQVNCFEGQEEVYLTSFEEMGKEENKTAESWCGENRPVLAWVLPCSFWLEEEDLQQEWRACARSSPNYLNTWTVQEMKKRSQLQCNHFRVACVISTDLQFLVLTNFALFLRVDSSSLMLIILVFFVLCKIFR